MRISIDVELPEHKDYPEKKTAKDLREEIEYHIDSLAAGDNPERCVKCLKMYAKKMRKLMAGPTPPRLAQELYKRIQSALMNEAGETSED